MKKGMSRKIERLGRLILFGLLFAIALTFLVRAASIVFVSPTPASGTSTLNTSVQTNISVTNVNLSEFTWNWNGTNYTFYNDSLVLMLNFDNVSTLGENGTNAVDVSKYSNNGTCSGALCPAWNLSGRYGGAMQFNGATNDIDAGNSNSLNITNGTLVAWIKTSNAGSSYRGVLVRTGHYSLFLNDNEFGFYDWGGSAWRGSGRMLNDSNWHFVGITFKNGISSGTSFYVDGVFNGSTSMTIASGYETEHVHVGNNAGQLFNGSIDEVRIWNRVLSADEIKQHYYSNLNKFNQTQWYFYTNQSNLSVGTYNYQAFSKDLSGNYNQTEQRTVTVATVSSCMTLNIPNTVYTQNANIDQLVNDNCINITAQNITFDCNGYSINSSNIINKSGVYSAQYNTTVKNCNVTMGTGVGGYGIYYNGVNNGSIINNLLGSQYYGIYLNGGGINALQGNKANVSCTSCVGIYLYSSSNNNLTGNAGTGTSAQGIYLSSSSNNNILIGNNGTSSSHAGIYLDSSSNNNTLISNSVRAGKYGGVYILAASNNNLTSNIASCNGYSAQCGGISMQGSSNNTLTNNTISGGSNGNGIEVAAQSLGNFLIGNNASGIYGYYIQSSNNTNITDCGQTSGTTSDVYVDSTGNSINNVFLNCSYNISKESVNGAGNWIQRAWYYSAYVNDTIGLNVTNANVTAYNVSGTYQFNLTTDTNGKTNQTVIIDYFNTGGTRSYFSLYNIFASNSTYITLNHTRNVTLLTNIYNDLFTLSYITNSTIVAPQNASYTNVTSQNFTINLTSTAGLVNATLNIYNQAGLYNQTTITLGGVSQITAGIVVTLLDGVYNWFWEIWDLAGNYFRTDTTSGNYTITEDTTRPRINFTSPTPANNSAQNTGSLFVNVSVTDINFANISFYLYNNTNTLTLVNSTTYTTISNNVSSINWTISSDTIYYYNISASDIVGNSNQTETRTFTRDSINPGISMIYPTNITYGSNVSSLNYTVSDINLQACWYSTNLSLPNTTITCGTNVTGLASNRGTNIWTVWANDSAGNVNSSSVTFTLVPSPPVISNVIYYPNASGDVDPGQTIYFNASVTDANAIVSAAILQYYNGTSWSNATMSNYSAGVYNVSIVLVPTEANYTFNVWANNSLGNSNHSLNQTFQSYWDCSWVSTSDLGQVAGWDQNKQVGNITINNTGDVEFANANCSLDFRLTYDLTEGRIYINSTSIKSADTYTLSAKSNVTIPINATFLSEVKQESATITTNEFRQRSSTQSRNTTLILLSNQNGPYLYQTITSYPASVFLTLGNISLNGYLRNLMGSATINESNTAYNVSFNWTVPTGFTNVSGNLTRSYDNITDNVLNTNNVILTFSSLASMSSGTTTFYLYSRGYNLSGQLIKDIAGNTLFANAVNISFLCYNVSDGVCVTSCGNAQDPDCPAPSGSAAATGGGGGGGGGGGAAKSESVVTSADYQLVRGKQNEVKITFANPFSNDSLENLVFSVSGNIAKYVDIYPKQAFSLRTKENITIILTITSPTYISLGKQEITITMNAEKAGNIYTDSKKITLEIHELSGADANNLLSESQGLINQLDEANLSSDTLNQLLNQSEQAILSFDYETVRDNYNAISIQVKNALDSKQIVGELDALIKSAQEKGIVVSDAARLLELTQLSLERRDFAEAYSRAKDAQVAYALEVKGEFGTLGYYLGQYPGQISLAAAFLFLFSTGAYNLNRLRIVKNRIEHLKGEGRIINELIKVVQKECFKDKKMSMTEYQTAMDEYQKRLSSIVEELVELEIKRVHMLRFMTRERKLILEKEKVIELIKELQTDYMKKKSIETRTYEIKIESFNKRISVIEEKLATLEAQKAVSHFGLATEIQKMQQ